MVDNPNDKVERDTEKRISELEEAAFDIESAQQLSEFLRKVAELPRNSEQLGRRFSVDYVEGMWGWLHDQTFQLDPADDPFFDEPSWALFALIAVRGLDYD